MSAAIADLKVLLRTMKPVLNQGAYVFTTLPAGSLIDPQSVVAFVREPEALSVVMAESDAIELGLKILFRAAWITLTVHSDLEAVGLTAAFASALGAENISCNVIAGTHHDHIFVPFDQAAAAMSALLKLQHGQDQAQGHK